MTTAMFSIRVDVQVAAQAAARRAARAAIAVTGELWF